MEPTDCVDPSTMVHSHARAVKGWGPRSFEISRVGGLTATGAGGKVVCGRGCPHGRTGENMVHIIIVLILTVVTFATIHLVYPNFFKKESSGTEENDKS